MNLTQIIYFVEAAKYNSFTQASKNLYVTQSAISKQILELENELGLVLFDRKNKMELTESGQYFYEECSNIIRKLDNAVNTAKLLSDSKKLELWLGYPNTMKIGSSLEKVFNAFEQYNASLEIFSDSFVNVRKGLLNHKYDIILYLSLDSEFDENLGVITKPFTRENLHIYYDKRILKKDIVSLEDFSGFPIISLTDASKQTKELNKKIISELGFKNSKKIEVPNMETLFAFVNSGQGIAILGKSYDLHYCYNIKTHKVTNSNVKVGTDICYLKNNDNPMIKVFLNTLIN